MFMTGSGNPKFEIRNSKHTRNSKLFRISDFGFRIFPVAAALALAHTASAAGLSGTYIQPSRELAARSVEAWKSSLSAMRKLGMDTLIVQWSAENPVAYFNAPQDLLPFPETCDLLERLFEAAEGGGWSIHLGLRHDPAFWRQLTASDQVLRDYFLVRVSQNERVQKALLQRFGDRPEWTGYYIPEEIDDLSWRDPDRRRLIQAYVSRMTARLRANDPGRDIGISCFFRGRTSPEIFASVLRDIAVDASHPVDHLLVQDGIGVGDPPADYVSLYFRELTQHWKAEVPGLWGVVEAFRQTSAPSGPFTAIPADPDRVRRQIQSASGYFPKLILFTFPDYADPARSGDALKLYEGLLAP
jgi:hypothetical protein